MTYKFIYDSAGKYRQIQHPSDIGLVPEGSVVVRIKKPSAAQILEPWVYEPNEEKTDLIKKTIDQSALQEEKQDAVQQKIKRELSTYLSDWQNTIALQHDYRNIDQAVSNSEKFKQWDKQCRNKAIELKNKVVTGEIPIEQMTRYYFLNQMPELEDHST